MPETTQAGPCGELHEKLSACVSANVSVIDFYKLWVGTILWGVLDISSYAFNLSIFIHFMGKSITLIPKDVSERTIPPEDRESQGIVPY